ncbi:MAG: hypothetical protein ACLFVD_00850 [Dehalococcoidia bacterium]
MITVWRAASGVAHAPGEAFGGLGKAGLITVVVIAVIAIVTFVWIFRETRRRD